MSIDIHLMVSDVDGTLVTKAKELAPATVAAVKRLRAAGVPFTVISARPPSGLKDIARTLEIDQPMAAFNGGTIINPDFSVIVRHKIDPEVVSGMFDLVRDEAVARWLFADGRWHADHATNTHMDREKLSALQDPTFVDDFTALYDDADKITFVSDDPDLLARLCSDGQKRYGDKATVGQSQTYYLDVTDLAANKGVGVTQLAAAIGVPLEHTAVIGDMDNDVAMFERAGFAIAMGQASASVKAKAAEVTASNDADGVAAAIDRFVLPQVNAA